MKADRNGQTVISKMGTEAGIPAIGECEDEESCSIARFLGALDGPWATLIIRELLEGPKRFGELQSGLVGISPKTLTSRLRKLAAYGVVTRTAHGGVPPKVVYELTRAGQDLGPVLNAMAIWATEYLPPEAARPPRPRTTPRRLT